MSLASSVAKVCGVRWRLTSATFWSLFGNETSVMIAARSSVALATSHIREVGPVSDVKMTLDDP